MEDLVSNVYQIDSEFVEEFLRKKLNFNIMSAAVKIANEYGAPCADVDLLIQGRQMSKHVYLAEEQKLLNKLPWDTNLVRLNDGWYALRYRTDKGESAIRVDLLIEKDAYLLQRKGNDRDYNRKELDTMLPAYVDEVALEDYKKVIYNGAIKKLTADFNIPGLKKTDGVRGELTVSTHACKRWVQRCLHIVSEGEAEEYRKSHMEEIVKEVIDAFNKSDPIFVGDDGVAYNFDGNNLIFLVGNMNVITLYEEDFGFSKEINRTIVLQQIKVIEAARKSYRKVEKDYETQCKIIDEELAKKNADLAVLKARMDLLELEKNKLEASKKAGLQAVTVERESYDAEFRKLFKRWSEGK